MKKIRIIQIGMGHDHAEVVMDSLLRQSDIFEVAAFAVPEQEELPFKDRIEKFSVKHGVPKLSIDEALKLSGIEGAVIETEEENLVKYAYLAAEKNLAVHMDKPGGMNADDFEKLVALLRQKVLPFSVGYMYRFNPLISEALAAAKSGELGDIYSVEAHMDCEHNKGKREWLQKFPGGMMFYLGCHLIDLIFQIQGMPDNILPMNLSTGFDVTSEDYGMAVFEYKNGLSFAKSCAAEPGGFIRRQLVICGTKGTIEIKPLEAFIPAKERTAPHLDLYTEMRITYPDEGWESFGKLIRSKPYNRYDSMLKYFAELVCGDAEPMFDYDYELKLFHIIMAACGEQK